MKQFLHIVRTLYLTTLLFVLAGYSQLSWGQTTQIFNASGNFTVPEGITSLTVECWGGGGAGGGQNQNKDPDLNARILPFLGLL